jgi:alpha-tubulin suppressor-like RCC1 family protein
MFADMNGTLATAATHACVITTGGGVACWGSNEHGESDPMHVGGTVGLTPVAGVTDAIELVLGTTHSCALVDGHPDRPLVCWGARAHLYFDGDVGSCTAASATCGPTTIPLTLDLAHVWPSRSTDDFCVTDVDDTVWCWGEGGAVTSTRPAHVPSLPDAGALVVTETHGCAISTNSQLWCWGHDESGQLGRGTLAPSGFQIAMPVTFP